MRKIQNNIENLTRHRTYSNPTEFVRKMGCFKAEKGRKQKALMQKE
jgi:hypothetical protein